jgi:hypothetical protein
VSARGALRRQSSAGPFPRSAGVSTGAFLMD